MPFQLKQLVITLPILLFSQLISLNAVADILDDTYTCNKLLGKGIFSQALTLSEQILKQDSKNREGLLCKGRALGSLGKIAEGITLVKSAEKLSTQPYEHLVALTLLGNLQKSTKDYPQAIATYEQSLSIANAINNVQFQRINHNLLGETLIETKQIEAGLAHYLAGNKLVANDNERADNYQRLATTYSLLKQHNLAIENQVRALLMQKGSGTLDDEANTSLELARIYTAAGEYANAERTLVKVVQFSQENGGAYYEAKARLYQGLNKTASGDNAAAKAFYADASKMAKEVGDAELISTIEAAKVQ